MFKRGGSDEEESPVKYEAHLKEAMESDLSEVEKSGCVSQGKCHEIILVKFLFGSKDYLSSLKHFIHQTGYFNFLVVLCF
jgi:hypothetical protein